MSKKKLNIISTVFLIILLLAGLSVMLYPIISDWWNSKVQSRAVASYDKTVAELDDGETERIIEEARAYNKRLLTLDTPFSQYDMIEGYSDILDISGTGIMGYITIPVIQCELPIYHGTSDEVLNIASGHLEGSSLPVGGEDTHTVISAHRGLPSAKLFSDLDKLVVGDNFTITVLDEILTYEVEKILIVEPHEIDKLAVIPNKDYVTLMTCTPYGINTHRLLIRAKRVETVYKLNVKVTADAVQVDPMLVVPIISAPLLIALICFWIFGGRKKNESVENMVYDIGSEKDGE